MSEKPEPPKTEQQIRAEVAEQIMADADHLIANRVGAAQWEGAFRAAYIARRTP